MNKSHALSLLGIMSRYGEDGPYDMITKKSALIFSENDFETVEGAFRIWEAAGILTRLANIRTASPEAVIARFDWRLLSLCGRDALEGKAISENERNAAIRRSNQRVLLASLLRSENDDLSCSTITKKYALRYANDDGEAVEEAFEAWERVGAVVRLADIQTASPDTIVARLNCKLLAERGRDALAAC
jgi:hypothetical protein